MNYLIFDAIRLLLRLNDRIYGRGASREILRDLTGMWQPPAAIRALKARGYRPASAGQLRPAESHDGETR